MKKQIIASLVGAIIIFIWQFLSWSVLNVHRSEMAYTANQDKILECLGEHLPDEGFYFLPTVPPGASAEEAQSAMEAAVGKPWAQVSYHKKMENNMAMNLIRGFLVDFIALFLLVWVLMRFAELNFSTTLFASIAVGAIGYLTFPYLENIWFEGSTLGDLVDMVVQWGLVGAWLGWYLTK